MKKMLYWVNSICVLHYILFNCKNPRKQTQFSFQIQHGSNYSSVYYKKFLHQQSVTFLCWKSTSFEFIGVDVSQIFGLELWHQCVSLAGELVWLFVMTVHCKRTFFLRGQMKLKFAGSVQGSLCYWQYKGRSGMPKVSVICSLNIHWSLGEHTWHFALNFNLGKFIYILHPF